MRIVLFNYFCEVVHVTVLFWLFATFNMVFIIICLTVGKLYVAGVCCIVNISLLEYCACDIICI